MQPGPTATTALLLSLCGCAATSLWWQGGPAPAHLQAYRQSFERAVGTRCTSWLDQRGFAAAADRSAVLWLGDDHRDQVLHRRQLELLQQLAAGGRRLLLLLEAIGEQDQGAVDRFLQCRIDMPRLRHECRRRWPDTWLDDGDVDAPFYRELLQVARGRRWPVLALEPTPRLPLQQRDPHIAASVVAAARQHPDALLVVVVGQTHLLGEGDLVARTGLPSVVLAATPPATLLPPDLPLPAAAMFVQTDAGVLFFADRWR